MIRETIVPFYLAGGDPSLAYDERGRRLSAPAPPVRYAPEARDVVVPGAKRGTKPRARGSLYGGKPDAGPIKRQPDTIKFTITATVADDGTAGPTKVSSTGPFCSRPDEVSAAGYARVAVTSSLTQGWAVQAAKDCAAEQGADAQASRPTGNRNLEPVELENEDTNPPAEACSAAERGYVRRTDRPGRWREENDEEYEARLARLRRAGLRVP